MRIRPILRNMPRSNLVISIIKSKFFALAIKWCGRVLDGGGIQYDPANFNGLLNAHEPITVGELSQYVYCCSWMSNSIPRFAERIAPLRNLLELTYNRVGQRTKKAIRNLKLVELGWGREHSNAYKSIQEQLITA